MSGVMSLNWWKLESGALYGVLPPASRSWYVYGYPWGFAAYQYSSQLRGPYALTDRAGRTHLVHVETNGQAVLYRTLEVPRYPEYDTEDVTVAAGTACQTPVLVLWDDGSFGCWYMDGATQKASRSTDQGRTWIAMAGNILGYNLTHVHVAQAAGATVAVGVRSGKLFFVRSSDQGATQDTLPPDSRAEWEIGAVSDDCRACVVPQADGQMLVVAEDADGNQLRYMSRSAGYGEWVAIT
jgi:hypothetical protein